MARTRLNSSRLVGVLAGWAGAEVAESRLPLGDRLGQWLDFKDAIALYAVLNEPLAARPSVEAGAADAALLHDFERIRGELLAALDGEPLPTPGQPLSRLQLAARDACLDGVADVGPLQRYCLARQRDMSTAIAPLRAQARAVLAARSPALRQLAALDGVMEQALAARERSLLGNLPARLARRFGERLDAHRAALPAGAADDPSSWLAPGGWLAGVCADLQTLLRAELDLRLQPVAGLIESLGTEVTTER